MVFAKPRIQQLAGDTGQRGVFKGLARAAEKPRPSFQLWDDDACLASGRCDKDA